jgi:hypothetical protein
MIKIGDRVTYIEPLTARRREGVISYINEYEPVIEIEDNENPGSYYYIPFEGVTRIEVIE